MMMMTTTPDPTNTVSWTLDEFNRLAARADAEPERVQAAVALYQAKLINFAMFKDMLSLKD
jgi:hypothetical protein